MPTEEQIIEKEYQRQKELTKKKIWNITKKVLIGLFCVAVILLMVLSLIGTIFA